MVDALSNVDMICQQLHIPVSRCERATCIKGHLAPSRAKMKVAFHQFQPTGLLEECSKCKILALILLLPLLW